jgi:hypothetical protein
MDKAPEAGTVIHADSPRARGDSIFRLIPAALVSIVVHGLLVALLIYVVEAPANSRPQLEKTEKVQESRTVRAANRERSRPDLRAPTAPDFAAKESTPPNYKSPLKADISIPGIVDPLQRPGVKNGEKEKELADVTKGFGWNVKNTSPRLPEIPGLEGPAGSGLAMGLDPSTIEKYAGGPFGRSAAQRAEALQDYGGDNESEIAVNRGLEFLKRTQQPNGSWKVIHNTFPVEDKKKYTPARGDDLPPTALALLAFLSRGCTEEDKITGGKDGLTDNPYAGVVKKTVKFLGEQVYYKNSALAEASNQETYELYGVVTLALAELLIMTRDEARKETLKPVVQTAVRELIARQGSDGGWTHRSDVPKGEGHIIPTSWAIQALKTAQLAGLLKADDAALEKARLFVENLADPNTQGFRYTLAPKAPDPVPSVVGLLNRMHAGGVGPNYSTLSTGLDHFVFQVGPDFKNPKWSDKVPESERHKVLYWFYGTQALFHMGGDHWKAWNYWMRDYFLRQQKQVTEDKNLAGSWEPVDSADDTELIGGRMLRTCLAILTLEIYYRQVPLHLRDLAR